MRFFSVLGLTGLCLLGFSEPTNAQTQPKSLSGLTLDDTAAKFVGEWTSSTSVKPFLGDAYQHDGNTGKGEKSAEFTFRVPKTGDYHVLVSYTPGTNRARNVPIVIQGDKETKTLALDQSRAPELKSGFQSIGVFHFSQEKDGHVRIATTGTKNHVIADGIRLLTASEFTLAKKAEKSTPKAKKPPVVKLVAPTFRRPDVTRDLATVTPDDIDTAYRDFLGEKSPAPLVNDIQYLRRISLDIAGRQPTLDEFHQYLKDDQPDKRSRAVERLLASPDFGKNWGHFWSDVIGSRQEEPQLTFLDYKPFRAWLAERFNSNAGWDEMVFEIVTAVGKVRENPQATFIGFHQGEPNKLAGEATRVFLGTKIACAQCHDHPFIDMPQETFHGFAAFFVRSKVKVAQNDSGQIEITSSDKGEHKMPGEKGSMAPVIFDQSPEKLGIADLARRERLAYWMVDPENPYFARAFVNHVWARLMGRGFFDPVDDLGEMSDGKLLDLHNALADHFTASGFQPKSLFRVILASETYQQAEREESSTKLVFTGATPKLLRGDEVFDSLATAIELPDLKGKQAPKTKAERFPPPPKSTRDLINATFGYDPSFQDSLINRTMKQAMWMMNNEQLLEQLKAKADGETMLAKLLKDESDDDAVIEVLYARVLARRPTSEERTILKRHVASQKQRQTAFEDILWSLVNSAEFTTRK